MTTTQTTATAAQLSYIRSLLSGGTYHESTLMVEAGLGRKVTMRSLSKDQASTLIDHLLAKVSA